MAHMISTESGAAEFAYAGAEPWHKLGTKVPGLMTTAEALEASRTTWTVEKKPVFDYNFQPIQDSYACHRSDTGKVLGIVGSRYVPIQNKDAFAFFDHALSMGQGQIETAGALGIGERVFMMAKMPETVEILPGDPMERYLLVSNTHDGTKSLEVLFTNIRVVCHNTLTAALNSCSNKVSIRHTTSADAKIKEAAMTLHNSLEYWKNLQETCKLLAQTSVTRVEVGAFMDYMFPKKEDDKKDARGKAKVLELVETGRGTNVPGVKGSAWGLYNAFNEYLQYEKQTRNDGNRLESLVFGSSAIQNQKAFDYLVDMAA